MAALLAALTASHVVLAQAPASAGRAGAVSPVVELEKEVNKNADYAMAAYPNVFGEGGFMTFVVNHNAQNFEKDLAVNSAVLGAKMTSFNPERVGKRRRSREACRKSAV